MNRLFPLARTRSTSRIDAGSLAWAERLVWVSCLAWAALVVAVSPTAACAQTNNSDSKIDFNTQIRPILSNRCFACHGPDEQTVESGLRLDSFEAATSAADSGKKAIAPGSPGDSEILQRILSSDDQVRMPPPRFAERLTDKETELLTRWIESGAAYNKHWSYEQITPRPTPSLKDLDSGNPSFSKHSNHSTGADLAPNQKADLQAWAANPIDRHLLAKLLEKGLVPSGQADRTTLLRRLTLDLTGLPPTLDELDAFLNDTDALAYERLVDRLLATPAYGEHWGRRWLDLARYADSAGYADDPARTIWAYHHRATRWGLARLPNSRSMGRHGLPSQYLDEQRRRHE
jgi:mono/diheme cytochrome c family protein